jgi:hypothetical protein
MTSAQQPGLQKRKKRRLIQSKGLGSESVWVSIRDSLDVLSQAQESHQRIMMLDPGSPVAAYSLLSIYAHLDSQLYNEVCCHNLLMTTIVGKIEARNSKIITESLKLLNSQIRRLLEEGFKETEDQVRILVADLAEGMWAQQRGVIGMQQRIQQYRDEKGRNVDHGSSTNHRGFQLY